MPAVSSTEPRKPASRTAAAAASARSVPSRGTQGPGWSESYITNGRTPTLAARGAAASFAANSASAAFPLPAMPASAGRSIHAFVDSFGIGAADSPSTPGVRSRGAHSSR